MRKTSSRGESNERASHTKRQMRAAGSIRWLLFVPLFPQGFPKRSGPRRRTKGGLYASLAGRRSARRGWREIGKNPAGAFAAGPRAPVGRYRLRVVDRGERLTFTPTLLKNLTTLRSMCQGQPHFLLRHMIRLTHVMVCIVSSVCKVPSCHPMTTYSISYLPPASPAISFASVAPLAPAKEEEEERGEPIRP